ncbi:MAG: 2-hydroxyacyl-CoA dehydratase [Sedimentisphaerales bacterium]|nr:2-hydroxyacyl-CoA dehydratase [Sedimentisphaerales bacterium]
MRKVVYTCPYVPAEWIAAHGLKPCRIVPFSTGQGSEIIRTEGLCPYVRDFVNNLSKEKDCITVFTTVCDQMRRGFDIIAGSLKMPAFLMNVPSTWQTVTSQRLYIDELQRLGNFLVQMGGKTPSNNTLSEVMLEYDAASQSILAARDKLSAIQYAGMLEQFNRDGLNSKCRIGFSPLCKKSIPLAIIGGPLLKQDFEILEITEQFGGRIVLNATENGERGLCTPFNRRKLMKNPLMELADAYFNGIHDASRRPNSELYKWIKKMLTEREVRGIIFHRNIWCDIWHAELQRLKDWAGLPVLDIESTGDDGSSMQRNKNRIRAFLEILH